MGLLQTTTQQVTELLAQLGGLAVLAGTLAAVASAVHRWYVREPVPRGLALLFGLSGVAIYLNTSTVLGTVIDGSSAPTETQVALFNIAAFLTAAGGATVGRYVGDRFAADVLGGGLAEVEGDVGRLVQSVGRVVPVELPADIDDVVGYDPVPAETKEELAGKRFLFPRGLTVGELRERLVSRLKADYGVGHVDVELAEDGSVEYIALGSRAAGIGPTLPPATNAVAIRADPAFAASAGDLVQVWETDPMRRVLTAELRGVAEDTVTVAIDAADTQKIDPTQEYRLVTLPVEDRPDREFASLLRAAEETFSSVTVEAGSPLHGMPVGALDLAVVALEPEGEGVRTLPESSAVLAPGDVVFAIARPDALRRLKAAAKPLDPGLVSGPPPQRRRGTTQPKPAGDETPAGQTETEAEWPGDGADSGEQAEGESAATEADGRDDDADRSVATDAPVGENTDGTTTGRDGEGTTADDGEPGPAGETADEEGSPETAGKADASSFQELKQDFESGDADWAEEDDTRNDDDPAAGDDPGVPEDEREVSEGADEGDDEKGRSDTGEGLEELAFDDADDGDDNDGLAGLEIDDGNSGDGGLADLSVDDGDDGDDDLASLNVDDEGESGLSLDDEEDGDEGNGETASADEDAAGEGADEGDSDDDDDDGGGASSFQELKEEFESGEADWEDDISDSPGGDMRLDE